MRLEIELERLDSDVAIIVLAVPRSRETDPSEGRRVYGNLIDLQTEEVDDGVVLVTDGLLSNTQFQIVWIHAHTRADRGVFRPEPVACRGVAPDILGAVCDAEHCTTSKHALDLAVGDHARGRTVVQSLIAPGPTPELPVGNPVPTHGGKRNSHLIEPERFTPERLELRPTLPGQVVLGNTDLAVCAAFDQGLEHCRGLGEVEATEIESPDQVFGL